MSSALVPLAVPAGPPVLEVLPALRAAVGGTGPALAPHPAGEPAPDLPPAGMPSGMPSGTALAVGTSGSTGLPKRALLTTAALHASADATHEYLGGPGQWLLAMPAQHIAGLQVLLRSLRVGLPPVVADLRDGFGAAAFAGAVGGLDRTSRHYVSLVPTQLRRLLQDSDRGRRGQSRGAGRDSRGADLLRRFDAVLLGGAPCPPALLQRAADSGVRVVTTYGMSETAGGCIYDGRPLAGTHVRLGAGGRVSLGGATIAAGYLGRDDLTAAAFSTDTDGTRWFHTDDVGELDVTGRLRLLGRVDDLINTGGLKVAPRLVEQALVSELTTVVEAVVVGTDHPQWGQAVSAAVVLTEGADPPTVTEVRGRLRGILPEHALPRRLLTLEALPLRGPGKPDHAAIRAAFGDHN